MGKAIPTKIKPYPGLVKAWRAKQGSPGHSYDPPGKKRSIRHSSKPKKPHMKTGYGKMNKKPFARGSRGGYAWTGGKTPRYDPRDFGKRTKKHAKDKLTQAWEKIEKKIDPITSLIGAILGLVIGIKGSYNAYMKEGGFYQFPTDNPNFWHWASKGIPMEIYGLFGIHAPGSAHADQPKWNTLEYLQWKFTNKDSAWSAPFLVSLVTYLLCKLGIVDMGLSIITSKSKKIIKPIQKLAGGVLLTSTIGGLILPGTPTANNPGHTTTTTTTQTHNPSSMWG